VKNFIKIHLFDRKKNDSGLKLEQTDQLHSENLTVSRTRRQIMPALKYWIYGSSVTLQSDKRSTKQFKSPSSLYTCLQL